MRGSEPAQSTREPFRALAGAKERDRDLEAGGEGEGDVLGEVGPPPLRRRRELHFERSIPLTSARQLTAIKLSLGNLSLSLTFPSRDTLRFHVRD